LVPSLTAVVVEELPRREETLTVHMRSLLGTLICRAHTATDAFVAKGSHPAEAEIDHCGLEHHPHEAHQTPQLPELQDAFHR
jgi:hypothetical protein